MSLLFALVFPDSAKIFRISPDLLVVTYSISFVKFLTFLDNLLILSFLSLLNLYSLLITSFFSLILFSVISSSFKFISRIAFSEIDLFKISSALDIFSPNIVSWVVFSSFIFVI